MKILFPILILIILITSCRSGPDAERLYVGTYTQALNHVNGQADGIYRCTWNNGIQFEEKVADVVNPSFLTVTRDGRYLYAVEETGGPGKNGKVHAFGVEPDGALVKLQQVSSEGKAPCFLQTDRNDEFLLVTNYTGGMVSMYARQPDGTLKLSDTLQLPGTGGDPGQNRSHPHAAVPTPDNQYVLVPDKGSNCIWQLALNREQGNLSLSDSLALQPGAGPRHLVFHQNDRWVYVLNERDATISLLYYNNKTGELTKRESYSTLPDSYTAENAAAEIFIHPNGRYLYASNRGHNSIAVYSVDRSNGRLKRIQNRSVNGETPRHFTMSPDGRFMVVGNQDSNTINTFRIHPYNGKLEEQIDELSVPTPVCLRWQILAWEQ